MSRVDVVIDVGDRPVVVPCLVAGPLDIGVPAVLDPELAETAADLAWTAHLDAVEIASPESGSS